MKKITYDRIARAVSLLCIEANVRLRPDVERALKQALKKDTGLHPQKILKELLENAKVARQESIALCQDTGLAIVFADIGSDVDIRGVDMTRAINKGIEEGYTKGYLRNSVVRDPLLRGRGSHFTPCICHFSFGAHKGLRLTVLPKGFGCENKTRLMMFNPTASKQEIKDFIISSVREAGPDACPPYVLGIGIGGSADYACTLAKKALLRPINKRNPRQHIASLEKELTQEINRSGLGPMGLGGKTTVLGVNILAFPTHIAGLPVCVNISCHVLRSASAVLS